VRWPPQDGQPAQTGVQACGTEQSGSACGDLRLAREHEQRNERQTGLHDERRLRQPVFGGNSPTSTVIARRSASLQHLT